MTLELSELITCRAPNLWKRIFPRNSDNHFRKRRCNGRESFISRLPLDMIVMLHCSLIRQRPWPYTRGNVKKSITRHINCSFANLVTWALWRSVRARKALILIFDLWLSSVNNWLIKMTRWRYALSFWLLNSKISLCSKYRDRQVRFS